jgi:hypothetical protein
MSFEKYPAITEAIAEEDTYSRVMTESGATANHDSGGVSEGGDPSADANRRSGAYETASASEPTTAKSTAPEAAASESSTHLRLG